MALDQREMVGIYMEKPDTCKCSKSFPCGPLKGTTTCKVTLQSALGTKRILYEINTVQDKVPGKLVSIRRV